mgnify:CR=1 FL=1
MLKYDGRRTAIGRNKRAAEASAAYAGMVDGGDDDGAVNDYMETLIDMREYDVPYYVDLKELLKNQQPDLRKRLYFQNVYVLQKKA